MSVTTDCIARLVRSRGFEEVPEEKQELEEYHREVFDDGELGGEAPFRAIADEINVGKDLVNGASALAFVDDMLGINLRKHCLKATRITCWAFNKLYRTVDPRESHYRTPAMSVKKLISEGQHSTSMLSLGIGFDLLRGEAFIPEPRRLKLIALYKKSFGPRSTHASVKDVQSLVGQCQSLASVKPQGYFKLSRLHDALVGLRGKKGMVRLSADFLEEVNGWKKWADSRDRQSLHNLVVRSPTHTGFTDAAGKFDGGMGGFWLLEGKVIWWRVRFPDDLTEDLSRGDVVDKKGDTTINDLELAGVIAGFVILRQELGDEALRYAVLQCFADNKSAVSWLQKKTVKGRKSRALLGILEELMKETNCSILADFVRGVDNLADLPSRSFTEKFHKLSPEETETKLAAALRVERGVMKESVLGEGMQARIWKCLRLEKANPETYWTSDTFRIALPGSHRVGIENL